MAEMARETICKHSDGTYPGKEVGLYPGKEVGLSVLSTRGTSWSLLNNTMRVH